MRGRRKVISSSRRKTVTDETVLQCLRSAKVMEDKKTEDNGWNEWMISVMIAKMSR